MVMSMRSLDDALDQKMRELFSAEKEQARNLPRMARECENEELRQALERHVETTRQHINRLEQAFEELGKKPRASKSESVKGLVEDGKEIAGAKGDDIVKEAAIIAAAQQIEHFEIAGYGTCATWAKQLGHNRVAELLHETLEEEKRNDQQLSELAKNQINQEAIEESEER